MKSVMRCAVLLVVFPPLAGCASRSALPEPYMGIYKYWDVGPGAGRLKADGYAPPRTPAEMALFRIQFFLLKEEQDAFMIHPERRRFVGVPVADAVSIWATEAYFKALLTTSVTWGGERCSAVECGLPEMPPGCDDTSRASFFYKTVFEDPARAVIRELTGEYRMVLKDGVWKLDGSRCLSGSMRGVDFNFGEVKRRG